jgi:hypothetical protein
MTKYANYQEAARSFAAHRPQLEALGVSWEGSVVPKAYLPEPYRMNIAMAMDALPALATDPNSAVPAMLTTLIDPQVYEILFAPTKAAEILGENRKGTWTDNTQMFPVVEHQGEVTSYGDYATGGRAGANTNWPQRQAYLFQTVKQYGERELELAGLAKINWVSEIDRAAATVLNRFQNLSYLYGISGLLNYGYLNDPNLPASATPKTKAAGGATWFTAGGAPNATANEVYDDIVTMYENLVAQTQGLVEKSTPLVLVMSPNSEVALTFTNSFNVNVSDLLKKNFPGLRIHTVPQYAAKSTLNPNGVAAGNFVQLIAESVQGQQAGYASFNEKMRAHKIIPELSSFKQKVSGGTWGAIIRMPILFTSMVGV